MEDGRRTRIALLVVVGLAGCGEQHFRAETTWHPDGRVERAVYQPKEFFSEETATDWESVEPAETATAASFVGKIRDNTSELKGDVTYIAAWGTFLSPEAMPSSIVFRAADASRTGRLERTVEVKRLGFVTEYFWEETLTDVVSLSDMAIARREAVELIAQLVESSLRNGELRYDIDPVIHWIRSDGLEWFSELHVAFVEAAVLGELRSNSEERLGKRFAKICASYGLPLQGENGELLEGSQQSEAIARFLIEEVQDLIRTPEGGKIDEKTARRLLRQIGVNLQREGLEFEPSPNWKRAVQERFGSDEAAKEKGEELATRLFGAYQAGMFTPRRPFHYVMTVPGLVVESSGELIAENRVAWQFDAAEAFPFGYTMSVRCLSPNVAAQKTVLGDARLDSLEEVAEYARLLEQDTSLAAAVQSCITEGSLQPFDQYEKRLLTADNTEPAELARSAAFRRLIGDGKTKE